jgi:hypothetical protein
MDGCNYPTHYIPPERRGGFDYFMAYENNDSQNEVYLHGTDSEDYVRLAGYEPDSLTDLLISHLAEHTARRDPEGGYQPFFAAVSVQPPHDPFVPPDDTDGSKRYYHAPMKSSCLPTCLRQPLE